MKSAKRGTSTSAVEVANVSPHGFWLFLGTHETFVSFEEFPWFRDASIRELTAVERPSPRHLYWPALDVDIAVDSLEHPEKYPLISRLPPSTRRRTAAAAARVAPAVRRSRPKKSSSR